MQASVSLPTVVGNLTPNFCSNDSKILVFQFRSHANAADPLNVAVTSDRHQPASGASNHAPAKGKVSDRLHILNSMDVMRDSHRPGKNTFLRLRVRPPRSIQFRCAPRPTWFRSLPNKTGQRLATMDPPCGSAVCRNSSVDGIQFLEGLGDSPQQRQITANVRLNVVAGDLRAFQQGHRIARHAKFYQASFSNRVDHDDFAAAASNVHQAGHQPRMIAGRVAADQKHAIRIFQVLQDDRRSPAADTRLQSNPAGLMTVVAAIVDVVGTVNAGQQLQQKTSFVAATPTEVPK